VGRCGLSGFTIDFRAAATDSIRRARRESLPRRTKESLTQIQEMPRLSPGRQSVRRTDAPRDAEKLFPLGVRADSLQRATHRLWQLWKQPVLLRER
jgi:hypothetical protein